MAAYIRAAVSDYMQLVMTRHRLRPRLSCCRLGTGPLRQPTGRTGPDNTATSRTSTAALDPTAGYSAEHQGNNQGNNLDIIIDLTENDDHPVPLNSHAGSADITMIEDTAADNHDNATTTAQPFSQPSFLQLMD